MTSGDAVANRVTVTTGNTTTPISRAAIPRAIAGNPDGSDVQATILTVRPVNNQGRPRTRPPPPTQPTMPRTCQANAISSPASNLPRYARLSI